MTIGEFDWLCAAYEERETQADYRVAVLAQIMAGSQGAKSFRAEHLFPRLDTATDSYEIESIPDDWVQITGPEAAQWMAALDLERAGIQPRPG